MAAVKHTRIGLVMLIATFASACRLTTDYFIHDTEGRDYRVACRAPRCEREVESPSPAQLHQPCLAGTHAGFVFMGQRVVVVCPACFGRGEPQAEIDRCRAVRCETDPDCPPFVNNATPRCVHGLCEVESQAHLDLAAQMGLCMAGAGAAGQENARDAADRAAIARAACRDPSHCESSATCRAP